MKRVGVEVVEDASHPEGGHAVFLLHGVASLPDGATFRLKSVESRGSGYTAAAGNWPNGEQRPRAIRRTEAGVELLVGPDIAECSALVPGTLGVIEIPSAGIRGEFLWPSIRPTVRPRRRNLTVVKPQATRGITVRSASAGGSGSAAGPGQGAEAHGRAAALGEAQPVQVLREAAGGNVAVTAEPVSQVIVQVTALDHTVPVAATVAEAIGGNIVRLNPARELAPVPQILQRDLPAGAEKPEGRAVGPGITGAAPASMGSDRPWLGLSRRTTAIAASAAVLLSGGFLLWGEKADIADRAMQAKRETATVLPRAEAMPRVEESEAQAALTSDRNEIGADHPQRQAMPVADPLPGLPATPVANQDVTLRMRGGGFQISGELKGFDGTKYVLSTRAAGVLTMDVARFECVGEACGRPAATILSQSERPSPVKPDIFRIEGAASLANEFFPQLIRDYANSIGANVSELPREAGVDRYRISDVRGVELATIEVLATATSAGLASLERGTAAIALVDKPLTVEGGEARTTAAARGRGRRAPVQPATEVVVGLDGVAAVASQQTAPASISLDHLAKVFAGQITDWYDLGQLPGPIQLYLPPDGVGALDTFARQVLRPRGLDFARTARRMQSEAEAADAAARDPRGLALVSLAVRRDAKPINLETSCGLVVRPSSFTVKTGEYPLVRRLSLQLPPQLGQPSARGLVRMAQSGEVHNAVIAGRLVDQSVASLSLEEQAERMAWAANAPTSAFDAGELRHMLSDLTGAARLSLTFRFVSGTNELDQRSRHEVRRLAAVMKEPELVGKRVVLAGFTDAGGRFQANMAASARRAGQVRSALLAAAGPGLDPRLVGVKGYGPLAPVACNGTAEGARLNRRVEAWVTR